MQHMVADDFYAGLDLGQQGDYTALAVVQRVTAEGRGEYQVRHLERPDLGTPYPTIVGRVCALLDTPPLAKQTTLVVDATGVGRPVVDLFRALDPYRGLVPVTITAGEQVTTESGEWRVPKRDLVATLQVLLQHGRLKIADGLPHGLGDVLRAELLNFRAKINLRGHDSYEAGPASDWREGAHDDLVLAVALACWCAERATTNAARMHFLDWDD